MAQNRSHEIKQIESDLGRLSRAAAVIGKMMENNNKVNVDLSDLAAAYSKTVYIPQEDFVQKMTALNENIEPSLRSLNGKISSRVEELNTLLEKYRKEQEQYEAEQKAKQANSSESQG